MRELEKARLQDRILTALDRGSEHTTELGRRIPIEDFYLIYLVEELRDLGMVTLDDRYGVINEPLNHYLVTITMKGIIVITYEGGFEAKYLNARKNQCIEYWKTGGIILNAVATLALAVLALGYQYHKDVTEKKKVVSVRLDPGNVRRIQAVLAATSSKERKANVIKSDTIANSSLNSR